MIFEDFSERIGEFDHYLTSKLQEIDEISSGDSLLYRKILYVSFLDSLAACIYPNAGNKHRFTSLIDRFSHWEERDRICMLHVGRFCSLNPEPELEKLREKSFAVLKLWQQDLNGTSTVKACENPTYDEIKSLWLKSKSESGLPYELSDFKLVSLLYRLRNSLVHQFQSKGRELGPILPDQPFYTLYKTIDDNDGLIPSHFELVYPSDFLSKLCRSTLKNAVAYLKKGNINPFPSYFAGDYWLEDLNK
jgi:hypothetical protein